MAFEDSNRNPAPPPLVTPPDGPSAQQGNPPGPPVQNPAFRGPPPAGTPAVASPTPAWAQPPGSPVQGQPPAPVPGPRTDSPVAAQGGQNPRRNRFNQTLALIDYQRPQSPVPAGPPPTVATPAFEGGFQPAAPPTFQPAPVGEDVLRQSPGTELGGGDPGATAQVASVPPALASYLEAERRQIEERARQAAAAPAPAAYAAPTPVPAAAAYPSAPAFIQQRPASATPSVPAPPPVAQGRPLDQPFVAPLPSQPPPGTPWQRGPGDVSFERDLASLPGPKAPGRNTQPSRSLRPAEAPSEPVVAIKWAALIAIGTFILGMVLGMTLFSVL